MLWDYIKAIVVICILIFAAYYVTKITAKASGGKFRRSSNIRLSGTLPLGKDKSVSIVKIGEYAYILGVGTQRVEMLDKVLLSELNLNEEEFPEMKITELFKRGTETRQDGVGNPDLSSDTGFMGFFQRFKAEFLKSLKRMFLRGTITGYPPKGTDMKTSEMPENGQNFAEILKKQSEEKDI